MVDASNIAHISKKSSTNSKIFRFFLIRIIFNNLINGNKKEDTKENQGSELLENFDSIDIILSGHQHRSFITKIKEVICSQPMHNGQSFTKIVIDIDTKDISYELIDVSTLSDEIDEKLDLVFFFNKLFEMKIMSVFVEAGGILNGEMLDKNLVDKIYYFIAPKIIGDNSAKSSFDGRNVFNINDSKSFEIKETEQIENDILITLKRKIYD